MVPALLNFVIMGLLCIKEDDIINKPITNTLILNSYGLIILIKITPVLSEMRELTVTPFAILIKGVRKCQKPLTVFKASLKDIVKALYPKITRIPTEIRKLLPAQYYDHLPLFEEDMAVELPPHRPSIYYIFTLKKGKNG